MISVEMSDDIRKYNTKTIGPFTTRQLVSFLIGLVYSVPIAIFLPIDWSNKILVFIALMAPAFLCGTYQNCGAWFEAFFVRLLYWKFLAPPKRKCIQENTFKKDLKLMEKKLEARKLKTMSESERKRYLASKNKKNIKYSTKRQNKIYK